MEPLTQLIDGAVTLGLEVSPRKIDLVRVSDLPEVFASVGKVNRKTGEPLTVPRLSNLSKDDPDFPKPYLPPPHERAWRRTEVLEYAKNWDQKDGPRPKVVKDDA